MSIGSRITELRNSKKLTRVQLAEILDVPMTTLRNYEMDDREPGHKFIVKIANYFGVTTDYILGNEKPPEPEGTEDDRISIEEMKKLLCAIGFGDKVDNLSEKDVLFLGGIFKMLDAWFG